jgi:hypothetical protein
MALSLRSCHAWTKATKPVAFQVGIKHWQSGIKMDEYIDNYSKKVKNIFLFFSIIYRVCVIEMISFPKLSN